MKKTYVLPFIDNKRKDLIFFYRAEKQLNTKELKLLTRKLYLDICSKELYKQEIEESKPKPDFYKDVSVRLSNICQFAGIKTLNDLSKYTEKDFLKLPKCGRKSFNEAKELLALYGLSFGDYNEIPTLDPIYKRVSSRDLAIFAMILCGETFKDTGNRFNLSSERIRQRFYMTINKMSIDPDYDTHIRFYKKSKSLLYYLKQNPNPLLNLVFDLNLEEK